MTQDEKIYKKSLLLLLLLWLLLLLSYPGWRPSASKHPQGQALLLLLLSGCQQQPESANEGRTAPQTAWDPESGSTVVAAAAAQWWQQRQQQRQQQEQSTPLREKAGVVFRALQSPLYTEKTGPSGKEQDNQAAMLSSQWNALPVHSSS
jgi:hypothetical protein